MVGAGGVPLFADLDADTCNISADAVQELLGSQDNVGAVMVTHFYGLACDVSRIRDMCDRHGVPLIEDSARPVGACFRGRARCRTACGTWPPAA